MFNLSKILTRPVNLPLLVFMIFFINVQVYGSDNYPYGCKVYQNDGTVRVYTDYLRTEIDYYGTSYRYYSLSKDFVVDTAACHVVISETSPYPGDCIVNESMYGQMVTIISTNPCPLDDYIPFSLVFGAVFGLYLTRKRC